MPPVKGYICSMPETVHKRMSSTRSRRRTGSGILTGSLMALAIVAITGFQGYWLKNNYDREKENLNIMTSAAFKETIQTLQASKIKLERLNFQFDTVTVSTTSNVAMRRPMPPRTPAAVSRLFTRPEKSDEKKAVITLINLIQEKMRDSLYNPDSLVKKGAITIRKRGDDHVWIDSSASNAMIPPMVIPILDSVIGKPENIKSITVDGKSEKGSVISIVYKDDKKLKAGKDSANVIPDRVAMSSSLPGIQMDDVRIKTQRQPGGDAVYRFLHKIDSLYTMDSVTVNEVTAAYAERLKRDNINVPFTVEKLDSTAVKPDNNKAITIGFSSPVTFELTLGSTLGYMFKQLKLPILFSLLLVGLTIAAFLLLYRNLMKQKRLGEMKNDLISNISHELKTPIATVGVALEALKSFNAMHDPARTKEYIDISQGELQRLNLLVDKVLKLSIFEKKDIELKKERFDYKQLTSEIMNSMKLQFEKYHAKVSMHTKGDSFYVDADKLHITSVVYNLLDNALKYSTENPVIDVKLTSDEDFVRLSVQDNGIGIPTEYTSKVFEKFFRVPTGDKHNIKGYGLGLSYVAEVVKRHNGEINVESEAGKGSTFTVALPVAKIP